MDRRSFLFGTAGAGAALTATPAGAGPRIELADLRGSIGGEELGLHPGALDDQSRTLQDAMDRAVQSGRPLFLPPGRYEVSNIRLPARLNLVGVPGETRLVYGGGGSLVTAEGGAGISVEGIVLDGANRALADDVPGLVHLVAVEDVLLDRIEVVGSSVNAVALEGCSGRIAACRFTGARAAGLWSIAGRGVSILDTLVADCGDGGILVHRWQEGQDGTVVARNRIERIGARSGDGGQVGHGIALFRTRGVTVADNHVADCAFSAIRTRDAANVRIAGNQCLGSGEAAIRAEGGLDGGLLAGNIVEDAAIGIAVASAGEASRLASVNGNLIRSLRRPAPRIGDGDAVSGIGIAVETDTAVTGNVVEGAPALGLLVGWGSALRNVVATGNMIRDAATGIGVSVVDGAGAATIAANVIGQAPDGAVRGMHWSRFVTGDLAFGGAAEFPHLTIGENRVG